MVTVLLVFSGVILSGVGVLIFRKKASSSNQYNHKKVKRDRSLGKNPLESTSFSMGEDADTVLGLKPEKTQQSENTKNIKQTDNSQKESLSEIKKSVAKKESVSSPAATPVVLYLLAPKGEKYTGYELLQAMLSSGLRFGDQHIFHRHANKDAQGEVLFHCASAEKPGTFDVSKMGDFSTAGLCFFFTMDTTQNLLSVYDAMLDTVEQLLEDLGGAIHDMARNPLTKEGLAQFREQLQTTAEQNATADMFV